MRVETIQRIADVGREEWDLLVGDGSAFLEWEWLSALEESYCVGSETGWVPRHLTARDETGRLVAACPLYVKTHSMGEFVFDHAWADASERAGIPYYPKLLVGVPFTPVPGERLLTAPGADRHALMRILGEGLLGLCSESGASSIHVNFCLPDEAAALAECGFDRRVGLQFHWRNRGWDDFDGWLGALRSKRRKEVRRERRELSAQGVEVRFHSGDAIPDELFEPMFRLYCSTIDKFSHWGRQYLNEALFDLLRDRWRHRLSMAIARRGGEVVGGALNVRKGEVLHGRYWGCFEELRFLHFNVCYHAAIEHCIAEGITWYSSGSGGGFKRTRGFDAEPVLSMHHVTHPGLRGAVRRFLEAERPEVEAQIRTLRGHSALRAEVASAPAGR